MLRIDLRVHYSISLGPYHTSMYLALVRPWVRCGGILCYILDSFSTYAFNVDMLPFFGFETVVFVL